MNHSPSIIILGGEATEEIELLGSVKRAIDQSLYRVINLSHKRYTVSLLPKHAVDIRGLVDIVEFAGHLVLLYLDNRGIPCPLGRLEERLFQDSMLLIDYVLMRLNYNKNKLVVVLPYLRGPPAFWGLTHLSNERLRHYLHRLSIPFVQTTALLGSRSPCEIGNRIRRSHRWVYNDYGREMVSVAIHNAIKLLMVRNGLPVPSAECFLTLPMGPTFSPPTRVMPNLQSIVVEPPMAALSQLETSSNQSPTSPVEVIVVENVDTFEDVNFQPIMKYRGNIDLDLCS